MSHSSGAVLFPDGKIMFFEYNGTVDVCMPFLYETREELYAYWRRQDWINCNDSKHNHVRVRIATTYGFGSNWDGFACNDCNCLIEPLEPNYDTEVRGLPVWFPSIKGLII